MADFVVSLLLENLNQLIRKEGGLILGVAYEVKSLCDKLEMMQPFLRDCGRVTQEDESVKVFLNKLRDLAYDAEDTIDTYVVSTTKDTRDGISRFVRFGKPLMKLGVKGEIASKIEEITKRMDGIYATKEKLGIVIKKASEERPRSSKKAGHQEQASVVGFKAEANILVERLIGIGQPELAVISIVGMGGLGKTTLAQKIYNHPRIKNEFKRCAWVSVSREYKPTELLLTIIKQFTIITGTMEKMDDQELGRVLQNHLRDTKYLIVMDDVWIPQVWQDLNSFFPNQGNGSRVMITTRDNKVAVEAHTDAKSPPHKLRFLDEEESWELFRNKAFRGENCSPEWEEVGRQIAEKCGGLPLAIVVLGGLLSEKEPTFKEWRKVTERVSVYLNKHPDRCKNILALSYDDLPYYLKPCFLYFGMFPEDHEIPARQLIQLWIAEGFIQVNDEETMEETAETYLEKLVDRSLIQVARRSDYGLKTCRIHDLLRDLCISEAQVERHFQFHGNVNSPPLTDARRLAGDYDTLIEICCKPGTVEKLRSLLCFTQRLNRSNMLGSHASKYSSSTTIYKSLPLLRVLRIEHTSIGADAFNGDKGKMIHLRFLGISCKTAIINISPSLYNARNLQTLNLRLRNFIVAPDGIWKMKKLRHVYFRGPTRLTQPSRNESSLKFLQTLSTICPSSCSSGVLSKLPNLLNLGVSGDLESHMDALNNNLKTLKHLQTLKLVITITLSSKSRNMMRIPSGLPPNLTKLTLCDTALLEDPMPVLGDLQNLQILKLVGHTYLGNCMVCSESGFPRLQFLQIVRSTSIERLLLSKGTLRNLNHLVVRQCPSFKLEIAVSQLVSWRTAQQQDLHVEHA